jgi:type I restriction enzyme S subunit
MKETKFKQTEVGLIPSDWEINVLGQITSHVDYRGKTPPKTNQGVQLITAKNIRMGHIDYKNNQEYVSANDYLEIMKRGLPQKGDVLITTEAPAGYVAQIDNENIALAQRVIKYRGNESVNNDYLCCYFQSFFFQDLLRTLNTGGTVQGIKGSLLHTLPVILPPLAEQKHIAQALSDVDAVISTTEKLVAKKKALKQGTMQTLLSGKMRIQNGKWIKTTNFKQTELGPIPQEWEVQYLGDLCNLITKQTGFDYSATIKPALLSDKQKDTLPFIQNKDFCETQINFETDFFIPINVAKKFPRIFLDEDVLLISISGRIGNVAYFKHLQDAFIGGAVGIARFKEKKSIEFVMRYLMSDAGQTQIFANEKSGAQHNLTIADVRKLLIPMPSQIEQSAIATVLSDMDSEIAALETKLTKYRTLKTGMMQQLLTGKVRLVDSVETTSECRSSHSVPLSFKRSVLAAEIADRLCDEPTFGHVKMEKMLFLTEKMCNIDIDSSYHRDAAGPFDNRGLHSIDSQLAKQKWFKAVKQDKGYRYAPLEKRGGHKQYFERYFSDRLSVFNNIINIFKTANTEQCEIVATLYSAWEDFLKQGISPTDEQIVTEVLTNWHKSKERISKNRWLKALLWMKDHEFIPEVGEKIK